MPVEIYISRDMEDVPRIEAREEGEAEVSNEDIGRWMAEGFYDEFELVGRFPPLQNNVTLGVKQSKKLLGGTIPWFDESHVREGVKGIAFLNELFKEMILGKEVEPYVSEGKPGIRFSVTIYTERIKQHPDAWELGIKIEGVSRSLGMYFRLWMLRYEYPDLLVEGKRIGDYTDFGREYSLFGLTADYYWMKRDQETTSE